MSVPTIWPEGPTHSLRIRSQPMAPQPTSRARPPDPPPTFERSCRPVGLPHARLQPQALQLRGLVGQQVVLAATSPAVSPRCGRCGLGERH